MRDIRIMGIDPGSHKTGFGVLELRGESLVHLSHGIISLEDEVDFKSRLSGLSSTLQQLIKKYRPDWIVVEKMFLSKNPKTAFILGHARGVVLAQVGVSQAQLAEYPPRVVKKALTGNGASDKKEVALTLQRLLGLPQFSHWDSSDALALAWHQSQVLLEKNKIDRASLNI
jgi:crossover junction endodeoxyribonuclease RuvC